MWLFPQKRTQEIDWSVCSDRTDANDRILYQSKGKANVFCLFGDFRDPKAAKAAAEIGADSFLRRPSLKQVAMETIAGIMNHTLMAWHRPRPDDKINAAVFFLLDEKASCVISGDARIWLFMDQKLLWKSESKMYPCFGDNAEYKAAIPDHIEIPQKPDSRLALLLCSASPEDEAQFSGKAAAFLEGSGSSNEWIDKCVDLLPEGSEALAAFLTR